jgi:DNA-binding protein HU-beta
MSATIEKPKATPKVAAPGDDKLFKKGDLVVTVSEKTGLPRPKANAVVEAVLEILAAQLTRGAEVRFGGFGSFIVAERKAGKGRDPRTGVEIDIPASKTVRFRPSKGLRDSVSGKLADAAE